MVSSFRSKAAVATARWRARNPEKSKASSRRSAAKWRKANPQEALAHKKKWRQANLDKANATARLQSAGIRSRNQATIRAAKAKPCADCEIEYPFYVMDLDHVRGKKLVAVGHIGPCSIEKLLAEIAKCDVVCSNCHRERTFRRKLLS